jgi:hypothetical protein
MQDAIVTATYIYEMSDGAYFPKQQIVAGSKAILIAGTCKSSPREYITYTRPVT